MKILAGILISLYLGLTLFGLYQYKAHNRRWGMKLVVWMSGLVLLVGVGLRFGGWGWLALLLCMNWYVAGALLDSSARKGQTGILTYVLWSRPGSVNAKDKDGVTALHRAAFNGHTKIVEILLASGAEVNAENNDGGTPLDWAEMFDEDKVINLLRKHSAKTGKELDAEAKEGKQE